ncbi:tRNA A64-2'-O-ribosylphosphate transferase [Malassezia caprae]|uniref:tRNA A64-2'-O-ribosylphosphate transferase n=1 Tax=Malassezia caprae TaxID=1381934 RepID=A0AAF0ITN4_9BASI|nr:tRNA A64-2'-O-ribosylphosphate transferase [Malassezia caprae]
MDDTRHVLKALRREQRDLWSRLASIAHDARYVDDVCAACFPLPLIANLRCGAWYTDPARLHGTAYFKSTDGHMYAWDLSLKRANLHLAALIEESATHHELTGCILVDSTRRGKRFPDALAKTVPIWCAVLNRASARIHGTPACPPLATPADAVARSEHAQIEAHLDAWTDRLCCSDLRVPRLSKPLVPVFAHAPHVPSLPTGSHQHHVVLVSVSPAVTDTTSVPAPAPGAMYVQGAGDDHEAWAEGLTPGLFWQHRTALLNADLTRDARVALVHTLVAHERARAGRVLWLPGEADAPPIAIPGTGLAVQARAREQGFSAAERAQFALLVHCDQAPSADERTPRVLALGLDASKRGLVAFSQALPAAVDAITEALHVAARDHGATAETPRVLVCCETGFQLSGALVIAVLAASFDENRRGLFGGADAHARLTAHRLRITKDTTQRRLQWFTSAVSAGAPSRAHLQRVNAYLMGPQRQVRVWDLAATKLPPADAV